MRAFTVHQTGLGNMINMKRLLKLCTIIATALLASCGTGASSAPPPTGVTATAGDSSVSISFTGQPGVTYWLFFAQTANNVTPDNCTSFPSCQIIAGVVSPALVYKPSDGIVNPGFTVNAGVTGLTNGATYSFSINGRKNGGPGGSGSPSVSAVPRLAGDAATWTTGTPPASTDLNGVATGTATISGVRGNVYVAAGANGTVFYSTDGTTWNAGLVAAPGTSANLDAVVANNTIGSNGTRFVAAGASGTILYSSDAQNWTSEVSPTTNEIFGLAFGGGKYVAVGAGGTILTSGDGVNWTAQTSGTSNNLYGVAYAGGTYVAVGAAGALLTSTDGVTWTAGTGTPLTTNDLKGVSYGGAYASYPSACSPAIVCGVNTFVVVGAAGTLITSVDGGASWVLQTPITTTNLNAVTYGHQFIAVGDSGGIYTSTDGMAWAPQAVAGATGNLYSVSHGSFDYSAVGAAGLNLFAK
jgi:hypothetical protein